MAVAVKGEVGAGDIKTLASNVAVNWANGANTVYTAPAGVVGFEIYHIILKSPTGTQPLSWSATQGGILVSSGLTIPGVNQGFLYTPTIIPVGTAGQAIVVQGITSPAGTALCTVIGTEY